ALVEAALALLGAEADRRVTVLARAVEERRHQLTAEAAAATARDDGDRELRRPLVDEAEARLALREEAVPGRTDGTVLPRNQSPVTGPPPVVHIARHRKIRVGVEPPVVRVLEHVAEEPDVL